MNKFTYYQHKQDSTYLVRVNGSNFAESFIFPDREVGMKATWTSTVLPADLDGVFIKVGIRQLPSCARNASVRNIALNA